MQLFRSAMTVGAFTALSRITGFVRDLLIAAILGAGAMADAFFISFKLANFLRRLFAEGAFNAGFVPLFARTLEGEGKQQAKKFAEEALAIMSVILLAVVLVIEIFMPYFVSMIAVGFEPGQERFQLAVELSRITFPYLMCISLAALFSGVLNSIGNFAAAAFAPVLLNLILITSLLLASLHPQTPAHALAWGVALAGILQLIWVAYACHKEGFGLRLIPPVISQRVRRLFQLILPGAVGAGVYQINFVIDIFFASTLPVGAISYLFYADRLNQLPLGIIGIAIGTALLPLLSRQLRAGHDETAKSTQIRAAEIALFLTLPAAAALIVIGHPIIAVLFERGAFTAADSEATSFALAMFATGLPAYVLIKVLAPGFFAREDTVTPVKIAALCLLSNILLILIFIGPLAHAGIALATSLSNWLNVALLWTILQTRGLIGIDAAPLSRLARMAGSALCMAVCLIALNSILATSILNLAVLVIAGALVYLGAAQLSGAVDLRELRQQLTRNKASNS